MPDVITALERRLIHSYIDRHGVTVIPRGVGTPDAEVTQWGRTGAEARMLQAREDAIIAAAAVLTVGELMAKFDSSAEGIYRSLRRRNAFAVGMADRR
jgi:hypothetical protein